MFSIYMLNNYSIVKHGSKPTWISNERFKDEHPRLSLVTRHINKKKKYDHILFKDIVPRGSQPKIEVHDWAGKQLSDHFLISATINGIKVGSFNMQELYGIKKNQITKEDVIVYFKKCNIASFDFIGLQEVNESNHRGIIRLVKSILSEFINLELYVSKKRYCGTAVVFNTSKWSLKSGKCISRDEGIPKGATSCLFKKKGSFTNTIRFTSVHLVSMHCEANHLSYHYCDTVKRNEEMVKYTKTDLGIKMPHIIVGDFNTENVKKVLGVRISEKKRTRRRKKRVVTRKHYK